VKGRRISLSGRARRFEQLDAIEDRMGWSLDRPRPAAARANARISARAIEHPGHRRRRERWQPTRHAGQKRGRSACVRTLRTPFLTAILTSAAYRLTGTPPSVWVQRWRIRDTCRGK